MIAIYGNIALVIFIYCCSYIFISLFTDPKIVFSQQTNHR